MKNQKNLRLPFIVARLLGENFIFLFHKNVKTLGRKNNPH